MLIIMGCGLNTHKTSSSLASDQAKGLEKYSQD